MSDTDDFEPGGAGRRPHSKSLSDWRIEQIEIRLDRDLKDLRTHVDRCVSETKKYLDEEIKDIRDHSEKRFSKIENFIICALLFIATPVVGAMVAIVLKNPPSL